MTGPLISKKQVAWAGPNAKRGTAGATIHHEPAMGVGKVGRLRGHGKSPLWIEGQKWSKCVKLWNWGWYLGYLPGWGCHSTISWNMIVAVWVRLCWLWGLMSPRNMTGGTGWSGWTWGPKRCFWHFQNGFMCGISWVYHGISMDYVSMSYLLMPLKNGSTWIFLELTFSKLDSSIPQKRRNTSGPFTAQKNTRTWGFDRPGMHFISNQLVDLGIIGRVSIRHLSYLSSPVFFVYTRRGKNCHYIWHLEVALTCFN